MISSSATSDVHRLSTRSTSLSSSDHVQREASSSPALVYCDGDIALDEDDDRTVVSALSPRPEHYVENNEARRDAINERLQREYKSQRHLRSRLKRLNAVAHAAAGLDVLANEPQLDSRYFNLPNVLMTPHVGSSTREARVAMAAVLLDAMEELARGSNPRNRLV